MNDNNIFLSIVIPVYNGERCIERCLNSIWSQELTEGRYEVICVNDSSTDNTAKVIEMHSQNHPNLILSSNQMNLCAGVSRNKVVKLAWWIFYYKLSSS